MGALGASVSGSGRALFDLWRGESTLCVPVAGAEPLTRPPRTPRSRVVARPRTDRNQARAHEGAAVGPDPNCRLTRGTRPATNRHPHKIEGPHNRTLGGHRKQRPTRADSPRPAERSRSPRLRAG
ncbi:hypothetical protein Asi02nite_23520 [Asanoa siamensis]|uniref:Uncharacterized protein n=1 Tax=Asanoa siamensis TaxID=926357 RepID=A0ABQ4CNH0_9ACTN|nr:hypothetical protein Asi02nite_23520 [Asanoa siamensis]